MLHKFFQPIIRLSAFIRKEIVEVIRQPRLLFSLVLGPFLILLIFGIGYRNVARPLRTLFVARENTPISQQIEQYAATLGPQLVYEGVTSDQAAALELLRDGRVDVVAVTPPDALEKIRASEHATFILYHREIDPFQVDYVAYFGQIYIDEVNRRVLMEMTREGQSEASDIRTDVAEARVNAATLRQAILAGDESVALREQSALSGNVDRVALALGASLGLLSGVQQTVGGEGQGSTSELLNLLTGIRENNENLERQIPSPENNIQRLERLAQIEEDLMQLEIQLAEFTSINPGVLVRPFTSEAQSIAPLQPEASDFYAPAVIALLMQHLAMTFAALSIVRERTVGAMELFRVSPLSAGETLIGKYISYMILGGLIGTLLTLLMVYVLGVPMIGDWRHLALVIVTILFTSLGFGFIISLISQTDSQAVQYTMIMLLTSVFFSGFLMSLDMIWEPVQVVSWALPTTYGIVHLRDIALRGIPPDWILLGGLALIGLVLFILAWFLLRRMIATR